MKTDKRKTDSRTQNRLVVAIGEWVRGGEGLGDWD